MLYFAILTAKLKILIFQNNCLQNLNLQDIQTTGIYDIKIHTNNTHTRFQSNTFIFGCGMAKKGKGGDVAF